jgi:hypothetical protein
MRSLILTVAAGVGLMVGTGAAFAFTYENQGTSQPQASAPSANAAPAIGFGAMDPSSVLPPMGGESIEGGKFDFGPGAFNNGLASQPTRADSVGPSWLHPPR